MSRRLRGYPWPSLAISPYHSSSPAGLQGYIPCPHIAAACKFVLVVPLLHIHVWGSTERELHERVCMHNQCKIWSSDISTGVSAFFRLLKYVIRLLHGFVLSIFFFFRGKKMLSNIFIENDARNQENPRNQHIYLVGQVKRSIQSGNQ